MPMRTMEAQSNGRKENMIERIMIRNCMKNFNCRTERKNLTTRRTRKMRSPDICDHSDDSAVDWDTLTKKSRSIDTTAKMSK
mmetsp:Transcript_65268/g.176387  ORF Transcript_65268/g.176387 Transcript_65268/m.176387 type:complete len:82 (+) Transcript_65268:47-292(+)